ncbi:uncharacterized protein LOC109543657 isoform X1 [Dendroctonus ponderosae]|uniref:uncharacterized protein LOC109543657 isoform X1 n=1 Tax=Dendroctonus ponderosae TaxID=77166 RepID=UPI00203579AE|nr:uncharacterized protein LOC109543657 isoform X1 [Dendroctonus ponderosae]
MSTFSCAVVIAVFLFFVKVADGAVQTNQSLQYHYVCPKNFENVGRKCYHFSNTTATWFQSYFGCRDYVGSNLTVFIDRYDQKQLENFLFRSRGKNRVQALHSYWVGGFKDWKQKKWIYTDGLLMQYPTFKEIHMSERDNWTCLLIDGVRKRWKAEDCMERRPFICETKSIASVVLHVVDKKVKKKITIDECISNSATLTNKQRRKCLKLLEGDAKNTNQNVLNEPAAVIQQAKPAYSNHPTVIRAISHICPQNWMSLGNQCYLFSKERVTWSDAHFNCGQINAKLVMIRSKVQDQKLRIFLNGFTEKQERWIGGRYNVKTGEWIWALNGKPLKYNGFIKEPILNATGSIDWQAIIMDPQYGYRWSSRNQLERHFYICQVKGRAVKRLNYSKRPSATIEISPDRRFQKRIYSNSRLKSRSSRRANRNKRTRRCSRLSTC